MGSSLKKGNKSMNFTTLLKFGEGIENATTGEQITFGLQVVGIGMGVVFGVLILLIGILQLFKLFAVGKKPKENKTKEVVSEPAAVVSQNSACDADEAKIVAIASAAIAAARGKSDVDFAILSFAPVGTATAKSTVAAPKEAAPVEVSAPKAEAAPAAAPAPVAAGDGEKVNAPLPGNILDVKVSAGASVKKGDILCILEAMKMENEIVAPIDGTVATVVATKGSSVNTGDLLFVIG